MRTTRIIHIASAFLVETVAIRRQYSGVVDQEIGHNYWRNGGEILALSHCHASGCWAADSTDELDCESLYLGLEQE